MDSQIPSLGSIVSLFNKLLKAPPAFLEPPHLDRIKRLCEQWMDYVSSSGCLLINHFDMMTSIALRLMCMVFWWIGCYPSMKQIWKRNSPISLSMRISWKLLWKS